MSGNADQLNAALTGRYRIERELGAGGMATVYLAHDIKHERRVALKVLKPELAAVVGADRFLAEIKTTANLQHPHILALFDSGQVDGTVFYVMPHVEGESLRDRIAREKHLPIDDALRIAREVGDALHYAHGHGVIHRDIKPENILLQGGHAQVADFGIALAASKTGGTRMTETGMSLGTPRYMSPEQAMGDRTIDARTDVYALGCVLYEMLTGDAPFTGSTAQAIMAKVLTEKPAPIAPMRDRVPPHVEDAVLTALEKLPADRFASAAEFVAAIGSAGAASAARPHPGARGARAATVRSASRQAVVVAIVATVAAVVGWLVGRGGPSARGVAMPPASRLAIVEKGMGVAFNGVARTIDITADGQAIVFAATNPLGYRALLRRLDGTVSQEIPNSSNAAHLRLSRDGKYLYAAARGAATMQRIALAGGAWTPVTGVPGTSFMSFGADGELWYGNPLGYGSSRRGPDGRDSVIFPRSFIAQVLPDGRHGLGIGVTTGSNTGTAQWLDLRSGATTGIFDAPIVELRYTSGYLVYVRADGVMVAVAFNPRTGEARGAHVEIADNVSVSGAGFAQYGVSDNGVVAYIPGFNADLVRVGRAGDVHVLLEELHRYHSPRISPDGQRVAFDDVTPDGRDVWLYTQGIRGSVRATVQKDAHDPTWTLDGKGLYYLAGNGGKLDIFRTSVGTTTPPKAWGTTGELGYTGAPLKNGWMLTTVPGQAGRGLDIIRIAPDGKKVDTVLASDADESYVVPSPDNRWFAYLSDHSGRPEVYIRSLGGSDVLLQVSLDGASEPVWSHDGREIFYRRATSTGAELVAATIDLGATPRVVKRTALFDVSSFDTATPHANYDVSPDGSWFVFARRTGTDPIVVLQNVPELVRRIAQGGGATP